MGKQDSTMTAGGAIDLLIEPRARDLGGFDVRRVVSDGTWTPRVDRLPYWDRPVPGVLSGTGVLPG